MTRWLRAGLIAAACWSTPTWAGAQVVTPVYADDSVAARESLTRASELLAGRNSAEAVRVLQALLDTEADRVIETEPNGDLFVSVRARVHSMLQAAPTLLERYREAEGPAAQQMLGRADWANVERTRLLTPAGLEAALRLAQLHIEGARFEAARLTLDQLEAHPDRSRSPDAARIAQLLARYLDRAETRTRAARWATEAGLPAASMAVIEAPESARLTAIGPLGPMPALRVDAIMRDPLQTLTLSDEESAALPVAIESPRRGSPRNEPWMLPAVDGDRLFINDGVNIAAFDRFTLTPLWRGEIPGPPPPQQPSEARFEAGQSSFYEDSAYASVGGGVVVATTGLLRNNARQGDGRVHAFDAISGRRLWSIAPSSMDRQLDGSVVRGPALIENDAIVLTLQKRTSAQRVTSYYLASFGLHDGALRWVRLLGSSAGLPWRDGRQIRCGDAPVIDRGIIFRAGEPGIVAAVEAASGRPVWVRRLRMELSRGGANSPAPPWAIASPVVDEDSIVVIDGSERRLVRLDAATGEIRGLRSFADVGEARYLLRAGAWLGIVTVDAAVTIPLATFETATPRSSPSFRRPNAIRGRTVVAGEALVMPVDGGLAVVPLDDPAKVRMVEIARTGNPLALGEHLLITDESSVHTYLTWTVADAILSRRAAANPTDPAPGLALIELAFRAGQAERIPGAADQLLAIFHADPMSPGADSGRRQLFKLLLNIARAAQPPGDAGAPDLEISAIVLEGVIERLGAAADAPAERVAYLLELGTFRERAGHASRALEAYQLVLTEPGLSDAPVLLPQRPPITAGESATLRIRAVLSREGRAVYGSFDAEALREAGTLETVLPDGATLSALARRYPGAAVTPDLWRRAAEAFEVTGDSSRALRALQEGFVAAEALAAAGPAPADALTTPMTREALAMRLSRALRDAGRPVSALRIARQLAATMPEADLASWRAELEAEALQPHAARLGRTPGGQPQVLERWTVLDAITKETGSGSREHTLMESRAAGKIALMALDPRSDRVVPVWEREYKGRPPWLVRLDPLTALVFWPTAEGGRLEKIDAIDGRTLWQTPELLTMFPALRPGQDQITSFPSPLEGQVSASHVMFVADQETVAMVELRGRAVLVESASGAVRWSGSLPMDRVYDVDLGSGLIVAAGAIARGDEGRLLLEGRIAALNISNGELLRVLAPASAPGNEAGGLFRWARVLESGLVLAGLEGGVTMLDMRSGTASWTLSRAEFHETTDVWTSGSRAVVLDKIRRLWFIDLAKPAPEPVELQTRGRIADVGEFRILFSAERFAVVSARGVALFDDRGALAGVDVIAAQDMLVPPRNSASHLAFVDTQPQPMVTPADAAAPRAETRQGVRLHLVDWSSAMLQSSTHVVTPTAPSSVDVLDGKVLVALEDVDSTLVIDVPAAPVK